MSENVRRRSAIDDFSHSRLKSKKDTGTRKGSSYHYRERGSFNTLMLIPFLQTGLISKMRMSKVYSDEIDMTARLEKMKAIKD